MAWVCVAAVDQNAAGIELRVERAGTNSLRLMWVDSATPFLLQETTGLQFPNGWAAVGKEPTFSEGEFSVAISVRDSANRFFRLAERPLTRVAATSPFHGESGVGPTRETIIYFSEPLATNTFLSTIHLRSTFGGRQLLSRVERSIDRRQVTLFHLEPLPASARIRVTFSPVGLFDQWNRLVDVDGDGAAGGTAVIDFDTLGTTALADTAVEGTVFASEPVPGPNTTNFSNRPLPGVTITVDGMEETLRAVTDSMDILCCILRRPGTSLCTLMDGP